MPSAFHFTAISLEISFGCTYCNRRIAEVEQVLFRIVSANETAVHFVRRATTEFSFLSSLGIEFVFVIPGIFRKPSVPRGRAQALSHPGHPWHRPIRTVEDWALQKLPAKHAGGPDRSHPGPRSTVDESISSSAVTYPGFQRFLALGELGPKSRAAGGWGRERIYWRIMALLIQNEI